MEAACSEPRARGARVRDTWRQTHLAEQRSAAIDFPRLRGGGNPSSDVAHVPPNILVVVARQGSARQGGRSTDGARERRHDAKRLHAGARWLASRSRGESRRRIVHNCSPTRRGRFAKSLTRLAGPAGLEPATSWFVARRSIQLSYGPRGRSEL